MEAFGRALVLKPYIATVVLALGYPQANNVRDGCRKSLAANCCWPLRRLKCIHDENADVSTVVTRDGAGFILIGQKRHVMHGDCADLLLVTARVSGGRYDRDGIGLFVVNGNAPGVSRRGYQTQDRLRAADVKFDNVHLEADCVIGESGAVMSLLDKVVNTTMAAL
jgi:hypothetical protein